MKRMIMTLLLGRDLLSSRKDDVNKYLEVLGENMENTRRKVLILKTYKAYHAYRDILHLLCHEKSDSPT